jgi:hypothetical protein
VESVPIYYGMHSCNFVWSCSVAVIGPEDRAVGWGICWAVGWLQIFLIIIVIIACWRSDSLDEGVFEWFGKDSFQLLEDKLLSRWPALL